MDGEAEQSSSTEEEEGRNTEAENTCRYVLATPPPHQHSGMSSSRLLLQTLRTHLTHESRSLKKKKGLRKRLGRRLKQRQ